VWVPCLSVRDLESGLKEFVGICEIQYRRSSQEVVRHSYFVKTGPLAVILYCMALLNLTLYQYFLYVFIDLVKFVIKRIST